jgi:hypothetical protein
MCQYSLIALRSAQIAAPLSRQLGVADLERSAAFYRDVG